MRLLKILLILFVCAAGPAVAGPYEDAVAAYDKGDYATALRRFRHLAEQGNAKAQFILGFMYTLGQGVPQDPVQAVFWWGKGAEQGLAPAQAGIGLMYARGRGLPQDYVLAHMWLNLAASKGDTDAVKNRDLVAAKMTPAQIVEAQKLAREWKPK